jgi:DNA-binding response OmpR family regulator
MTDANTVLVVDDEDDLRDIMCYSLQRRGFTTLPAADPHEALAIARDSGPIDLLVTDLGLPEIPGARLAALLTEAHPRLRVLYVSGWSREAAIGRGLVDERAVLLQKPFAPDQLVAAARSALAGVTAGSKIVTTTR